MRFLRQLIERHYLRRFITYILICCMLFNLPASVVLAGPEGAEVIHGQVSLQQSGLNTVIHASDKSVINYTSFDIARPEVVQFIQPGSNASVLNRILSANPTCIDGTLLANGRVFFVNPAGVIIGSGATINVSQLVASGLNISNDSFINGQYEFVGGGGSVANYGDISAKSVYLVGKQVTNIGNINCPAGYVVMAAGDRVFLGQPGSNVIVEIGSLEPPDQADAQRPAEIINEGTVEAAGGTVILAAAGDALSRPIMANIGSLSTSNANGDAGNISFQAGDGLIDNTGIITATSNSDAGGTITAVAGEVINTGTIDVSGTQGGTVVLEATGRLGQFGTVNADGIEIDGGNINLSADGMVVLGTDSLTTANAGTNGDGGDVIAYSPKAALFESDAQVEAKGGSESGDGGFFEVSGLEYVKIEGRIDLTATNGATGNFLIDPLDLWIIDDDTANGDVSEGPSGTWKPIDTTSVSQLDIDILESYLGNADVTLSTTGTPDAEGQFGDIIFDADRYLNSGTDAFGDPTGFSLTVEAARNIEFTASDGIKFQGEGDVKLYAGGHIVSGEGDKQNPTVSTLMGDIVMEAGNDGSGVGIDVGYLRVGASGLDYPGEIRLSTTDGGDITTGHLRVTGNGYGSVYAFSSGNLTINGSSDLQGAVLINTNHVPSGEDASSFACLTAGENVTINGDVRIEAHGNTQSVASIWIGAGTDEQAGTVTVNGNLEADASSPGSGFVKSEATIKVYGSTIWLNGNSEPHAHGVNVDVQTSEISTTPIKDENNAVYDLDGELIQGSLAIVWIDNTQNGTCLNCGNDEVILPIALPDWLKESKNIGVYAIAVLIDNGAGPDQDGEGGALIGGTVFLDGVTQSIEGGTLTLINGDTEVQYEPPTDWIFNGNGEFADYFEYYVVDVDGNVSADPALVTITLINQSPVANPDIYDVSHNVILSPAVGTIEGLIPTYADTDPDPGDTLSAFLAGGGTTALGGSVVLNTDGTFTYTPPSDTANADDSFMYYVTDSYNDSAIVPVTISLTNQSPVANADIYDVSHNVTLSPSVGTIEGLLPAYADTDPDPGDTLSAFLSGGGTTGTTSLGGSVVLNTDGTFTYTPPSNTANADDSFMYYVTDSYNNSDPVPVTITITASKRTPTGEEALLTLVPVSPDNSDVGQVEGSTISNDLQWLSEELGLCEGDQQGEDDNQCQEITQAYLAGAFLQASDMRPHQAAAQLRGLAELLHDTDGNRIAALGRVINEFAQPNVPPSPEQFASIGQAFTLHVNDGTHYAAANQWLDALGEYTMLLISEIGWSSEDSVAFVMGKYGPAVTEDGDISVIAFIQMHLEGLIG